MKKNLLSITFCLTLITAASFAQESQSVTPTNSVTAKKKDLDKLPTLDFYATVPLKQCGWGMGFGMYAPAHKIGMINPFLPLYLRFGGEFYLQEMHHRYLGNVPLSAPQLGDAKVRLSQNNLGFNFVARLSTPYSKKFTPYIDVYLGARNFWAGMSITPLQQQEGYESETSKSLSNAWQFTYGASAGFMYSLSKYVKFNTGLMFGTSNKIGEIVDIKRAKLDNGSIITQNIGTPKDMFTLKVGFTFIIDGSDSKTKKSCNCNNNTRTTTTRTSTWGSHSGGTKSNNVNINTRPAK
jgi:hypothetical protein